MQELPLMRKATAVWLVENTSLTFSQIARFCGLHELEVQGIADGDVASGIIGQNPILSGQLTQEEIVRCESNPSAFLSLMSAEILSAISALGVLSVAEISLSFCSCAFK
jgi:hypothetical protein